MLQGSQKKKKKKKKEKKKKRKKKKIILDMKKLMPKTPLLTSDRLRPSTR